MSGIQSNVGLVSGIDYKSLVDQLITIEQYPAKRLEQRAELLLNQQTALAQLIGQFTLASFMFTNLGKASVYDRTDLASSSTLLTAAKSGNGTPAPGTYTFTPVRVAQSQQSISNGVASDTVALGKTGTVSVRFGRDMSSDVTLANINGGEGFEKGYIRITDASGFRATVDLRQALSINDVVDAINKNHDVDVYAEVKGDRLVITDMSGGTGTLKIQDLTGSKTATSLGIAGSADTDGVITGNSLLRIGDKTQLSFINDGNGLVFDKYWDDLVMKLSDGTDVRVDFNKLSTTTEIEAGAPERRTEQTIGDLLKTINDAGAGKLVASVSSDGKRLVFTDTTYTAGGTEMKITSPSTSPVLQYLGLSSGATANGSVEISSNGGQVTTRQLLGDLDSVLTSNLLGGRALDALKAGSTIEVQDRNGNKGFLVFSQADIDKMQTVNGAMDVINKKLKTAYQTAPSTDPGSADPGLGMPGVGEEDTEVGDSTIPDDYDDGLPRVSIGLELRMNSSNSGFELIDTTAKTASNVVFKDVKAATDTTPGLAAIFGLNTTSEASSRIRGTDPGFQSVSYNTALSSLNGGKGVSFSGAQVELTNSAGSSVKLSPQEKDLKTVGDVIDWINRSGIRLAAKINATGDGIEITDQSGGTGAMTIRDASTYSTFAKDLKIAGVVTPTKDDSGNVTAPAKLDASFSYKVTVEATDTLNTIRDKFNKLNGGFTTSVVNDGTGNPYRLSFTGNQTGSAAKMVIDLSALGLETEVMTKAQDAVMIYGDINTGASLTITSKTNTFKNAVPGIDITINGVSSSPITVTSIKTSTDIKASLTTFVENYNKFTEALKAITAYDAKSDSRKILNGDPLAHRLDVDFTEMLQKKFNDLGTISSLADLGVSMSKATFDKDKNVISYGGKMVFDEAKFDALYASDPDAIKNFFMGTREKYNSEKKVMETVNDGFSARWTKLSDTITAKDKSLWSSRAASMDKQVEDYVIAAEHIYARCETKRTLMMNKFYRMEEVMAKMQSDLNAISSMATGSTSGNSSSSM
ncbi:MAG: flagellar filament capping protein FliD [Thermoguttaceae bacterium]